MLKYIELLQQAFATYLIFTEPYEVIITDCFTDLITQSQKVKVISQVTKKIRLGSEPRPISLQKVNK